ncbi:MAG: hypothetical protein LBR45_03595 [Bacteroidales bacterium]|jgi:hypothetical protein|nr:hypothetical protein [Bacteroidales bacterium]
MKKIFLKLMIIPLLLIMAVGFASCGDKEPEEKYPLEVPFTEYSLEDTSCAWKTLEYGSEPNPSEIAVINSNEELENYFVCTEGSLPEIDFSKHTLLLARGLTSSGIYKIEKKLEQLSTDKYQLNVEIELNFLTVIESWNLTFITKKLNKDSEVKFNVTIIDNLEN